MLILGVLVATSFASFGFGYLAGLDAGQAPDVGFETSPVSANATALEAGQIVASKNGTKYYPIECAGANRISDENKVWFASVAAATNAGYARAVNCK